MKYLGWRTTRKIRDQHEYLYVDLHFGAGYGAILNEVLKLLAFEKDHDLKLRVRVISSFYSRAHDDCALTEYFDVIEGQEFANFPVRNTANTIKIRSLISVPGLRSHEAYRGSIGNAHHLFFNRFRVKPAIKAEAETKFKTLTAGKNNILGIHYRGSDKVAIGESVKVSEIQFIRDAKAILEQFTNIEGVYIATDEQSFLDYARREITSHPVFGEDLKNHAKLGLGLHTMPGDPVEKAKDAINVMLMLSQCRYLLKTASFLSAWSKVINPDLVVFFPVIRKEDPGYAFPDMQIYETAHPIPRLPEPV